MVSAPRSGTGRPAGDGSDEVVLPLAVSRGGALRSGDGADPRVPHDHAAREPDRLGPRADDLRGRARAVRVFRQRAHLADLPADPPVRPLDVLGLGTCPFVGPIIFDQSALVYLSWVATLLVGLYLARTRPGSTARRGRGAGVGRRNGDRRGALPLRARARRRRVRRCRRAPATASRSPRGGSRATCS